MNLRAIILAVLTLQGCDTGPRPEPYVPPQAPQPPEPLRGWEYQTVEVEQPPMPASDAIWDNRIKIDNAIKEVGASWEMVTALVEPWEEVFLYKGTQEIKARRHRIILIFKRPARLKPSER
jgi:hypothetical protein